MTGLPHRHWLHAISVRFGPYGDQTVHYHPCMGDADLIDAAIDNGTDRTFEPEPCDWALIGAGPDCPGKPGRHWLQSLRERAAAQADRETAGV